MDVITLTLLCSSCCWSNERNSGACHSLHALQTGPLRQTGSVHDSVVGSIAYMHT